MKHDAVSKYFFVDGRSWIPFLYRWLIRRWLGSACGEEPTRQCRRHKRCRFNRWVGMIPWRRAWQPIPMFLPEGSHGQRILVGYSPSGHKGSVITKATEPWAYGYEKAIMKSTLGHQIAWNPVWQDGVAMWVIQFRIWKIYWRIKFPNSLTF